MPAVKITHHVEAPQPWPKTMDHAYLLNWIVLALLAMTCGLLIWALKNYTETSRIMDNTHELSRLAQQLVSTIRDAETGQRGYLITGNDQYLEPYRDALSRVDGEVSKMRHFTAGNPRQEDRLNHFAVLTREKFAELGETIRLRHDRGEDAARAVVVQNRGFRIMQQLRTLAADLSTESEPLIELRIRRVLRILLIGSGSILVCVCSSVLSTRISKRALFDSEERFRTLANFIPPMAWMADKTGWIFWYNQRWYDYTGKSNAEKEGWGWQSVQDPGRLPAVLEVWKSSIALGQPFQMEVPLLGADGRFRVFLTRVTPWKDKDGSIVRWFGTDTDIDELTKVQSELRTANERLENKISERTADLISANKALEGFAYSVSHDLRAPLRHLDGFAELLRHNCYQRIDSQGQRYLDKVTASAQRMGRLIDDLLAFSRLQRTGLSSARVNLTLLQEEVRRELETDMAGRTVLWTVGNLPDVYGDRSMLRQVLVNLLSNAVKYTRLRSEAHIELGCSGCTENEATIFVRDNGAGFEMQYVGKLFEVFQRLHSEEYEGTGVGLAVVRHIVERQGGRVWAEGAVDQGATFYCSLRLNKGET